MLVMRLRLIVARIVQRRRVRMGMAAGALLAFPVLLVPTVALATDYTISDGASCTAFITAIGGTGFPLFGDCNVTSGTLGAGDTVTVTNNWALRPQGPTDPAFTNQGTVTINSTGSGTGGFYGAGHFVNAGTFNVNANFGVSFGPIDNSGTININAGGQFYNDDTLNSSGTIAIAAGGILHNGEPGSGGPHNLNNSGTITNAGTIDNRATGVISNACGGTITGSGTYTGNPPVELCATPAPTPANSLQDAAMTAPPSDQPLTILGTGLVLLAALSGIAILGARARKT
jgi:hypothetical protein